MAISYDRRSQIAARDGMQNSRGSVHKMGGASGLAEVLHVILEKGIVVDLWVRVSIIGIEILTVEVRAVIASVDTYLRYAEAIGLTALAAAPRNMQLGQPAGGALADALGLPTDEEILQYLEAHADGVRLSELQAYFGADRTALETILNRLVQEDMAVLDAQRGIYRAVSALTPATH